MDSYETISAIMCCCVVCCRDPTEQEVEVTPVAVCLWEASTPSVLPTVEGEWDMAGIAFSDQ